MDRLLRTAVAGVCGYEFGAITTRRYPTVSHGMWRLRPLWRALVWAGVVVALSDHFFTRRWV